VIAPRLVVAGREPTPREIARFGLANRAALHKANSRIERVCGEFYRAVVREFGAKE